MAQEQPLNRVRVKGLVGSYVDKISNTDFRHVNMAWLGFFGNKFHKENLHFRG